MKIQCFGCDVEIEGADPQAIADRFLEHAAEKHDWPYSEVAIRNYAINYAEAAERLTGSTERLQKIGKLEFRDIEKPDDMVGESFLIKE